MPDKSQALRSPCRTYERAVALHLVEPLLQRSARIRRGGRRLPAGALPAHHARDAHPCCVSPAYGGHAFSVRSARATGQTRDPLTSVRESLYRPRACESASKPPWVCTRQPTWSILSAIDGGHSIRMQQPQPGARLLSHMVHEIERGSVKVPQFQREFVWSRDKSARLIDSLLKGFPIGTFILWKTDEELRSIRNLGGVNLPSTPKGDSVQYVLDGQQRLTSLFAALKGLHVNKAGRDEDFREMYIDLAAHHDEILVFTDVSEKEVGTYVSVTDLQSKDFDEMGVRPEFRSLVREYKQTINSYQCSVIEVPEAKIDTATEIFTRINVTGQPLSVFEIMVAKTFDYNRDFDLGEKTYALQDELWDCGYETVPDIVFLQAISGIMTKECSKKDILRLDKQEFISTWPQAEDAIRSAVDYLRQSFRIPVSQLLPYKALLVPLAYFFAKHPAQPSGEMQGRLHDFFWRVSLSGRYSYSLEAKLAQDIRYIDDILAGKQPKYDYPVNPTKELIENNGAFNAGRSFIKAVLCCLASRKPKSFKNNVEVNISNDWLKRANSKNYHHFFPKASFKGQNVDESRINHIANITIVDDYLNKREIGAKKPSVYISQFQKENPDIQRALRSHLIDMNRPGVLDDDYDKFFEYRCRAIARELAKGLIPQDIDKQGQTSNYDDYEDLETAQREGSDIDDE